MTVIELGEISSGEQEAPAPVGFDRRLLRRGAVALVAVLCLVAVTGSARTAEPRGLRMLWSTPFGSEDQSITTATSVYTVILQGARILTAHNLDDGAVRWQRAMPEPMTWVDLTEQAGVLLVPAARRGAGDGGTFYNEFTTETVALDSGTGAELWRHPGSEALMGAGVALFTSQDSSGRYLTSLSLVRLRDGSTIWSHPVTAAERLLSDGPDPSHPDRLVTVTPGGRVEVLRFADGARLAAGPVEWAAQPTSSEGYNEVMLTGGRLFVSLVGVESTVVAYDTDTLRRLWRVEDISPGGTNPCGTALCAQTAAGVVAYDGGTGAVRWRAGQAQSVWPIGTGRLLTDNEQGTPQLLLDDNTGALIADLGPGVVVPDQRGTTAYFLRSTSSPAHRTSVSRLDLGTGERAVRGTIDLIGGYGCTAVGNRLACPTTTGRLIVTAVG